MNSWNYFAPLIAYFVGSIPFGVLIARAVANVDIRTSGSRNIGATNVGRVIGWKWGITVLVLDCLKGLLPTWLLPMLGDPAIQHHLTVACGIATILGHTFPCWLRFRGGKGVATALGVVSVVSPQSMLLALVVFVVTFAVTRIVSISSILAAIGFAASQMWRVWPEPFSEEQWSLSVFSLAIPALIILRHRGNILRLIRGEEPQFRTNEKPSAEDSEIDAGES